MASWGPVIIKMIAGRALAEKSERRQLERQYQHVEEVVKNIKEVTNEPRPEETTAPSSIYSSSTNPNPRRIQGFSQSVFPPDCERSMSSPVLPTLATFKSPCGPPDITARDLTQEELRRNYSFNNHWNVQEQPLPPMPEMSGFGRYRRAVNAPLDWQMEHLDRHMYDARALLVNHLGDDPPGGLDSHSWMMYRAYHSRAGSNASSRSSDQCRQPSIPEEYLDLKTGTRISRGFCASTTSSANSSFKEGSGHYRRDSNLSSTGMTSPGSEGDLKFPRRSNRVSPFTFASRQGSTASMRGLAAIMETQEAPGYPARKIAKPCEFNDECNAESAVASDDDDDEFEWADLLEVGGATNVGNLTKQLERTSIARAGLQARPMLVRQRTTSEEKKAPRALKRTIFERAKTRRTISRTSSTQLQLHKKQTRSTLDVTKQNLSESSAEEHNSENNSDIACPPSTTSKVAVPTAGDMETAHLTSCWYRTNDIHCQPNSKEEFPTAEKHYTQCITPSPEQILRPPPSSAESDTSQETLFPTDDDKDERLPCRGDRQRSGTVSTIRPARCASDGTAMPET